MRDAAGEIISDVMTYQLRQAERREAYEQLNYASTLLELRKVRERAAELASQHEPMATFAERDQLIRRRILLAVRYVLTGHKEEP
jgi:hypothetical protein